MSQYFTYEDLQGRVHTDVLTADSSCKTCSTSKCYNTYDNVQGVSLSKYTPFSSIKLGENDRIPLSAYPCDASMLTCNYGILENADPYNVVVKSTSKCDPLNFNNYEVAVPKMTGSLDRNKVESSRYVKHKSLRNSSNLASDILEPKTIRDLNIDKANLDVYNIIPFDYKNEIVVPPIKTSISVRPRQMSPTAVSNKNARSDSKQLSAVSYVKSSVSSTSPVKTVTSILTKPLSSSQSSKSSKSSKSVSTSVSVKANNAPTKINRVPLTSSFSPKRK
jgi:hypothetical protein